MLLALLGLGVEGRPGRGEPSAPSFSAFRRGSSKLRLVDPISRVRPRPDFQDGRVERGIAHSLEVEPLAGPYDRERVRLRLGPWPFDGGRVQRVVACMFAGEWRTTSTIRPCCGSIDASTTNRRERPAVLSTVLAAAVPCVGVRGRATTSAIDRNAVPVRTVLPCLAWLTSDPASLPSSRP